MKMCICSPSNNNIYCQICQPNQSLRGSAEFTEKLEFVTLPHIEPIKTGNQVMIGEQLSRGEQIRIAALNIAVSSAGVHIVDFDADEIIYESKEYERYIRDGK